MPSLHQEESTLRSRNSVRRHHRRTRLEKSSNSKKSLRILQWNAEGVNSKIHELRETAKDLDLDILLIQESKLTEDHDTPTIPGYGSIRVDRKNKQGGGIISFIRSSLTHQRLKNEAKDATETSTFTVKLSKNKWVTITNLYCTPASSGAFAGKVIRLATEIIPTSPSALICGDFNAHSPLWDSIQPSDQRGEEIEDWMIAKNLSVLN